MADDLLKRRWQGTREVCEIDPTEPLRILLDDVARGETKLKHVIVIYATEPGEGKKLDGLGFYQGGKYDGIGQVGMLSGVVHTLNNFHWGDE